VCRRQRGWSTSLSTVAGKRLSATLRGGVLTKSSDQPHAFGYAAGKRSGARTRKGKHLAGRERGVKSGLLPTLSDPAKFSELIRQDAVRKAEVIKCANLVIE